MGCFGLFLLLSGCLLVFLDTFTWAIRQKLLYKNFMFLNRFILQLLIMTFQVPPLPPGGATSIMAALHAHGSAAPAGRRAEPPGSGHAPLRRPWRRAAPLPRCGLVRALAHGVDLLGRVRQRQARGGEAGDEADPARGGRARARRRPWRGRRARIPHPRRCCPRSLWLLSDAGRAGAAHLPPRARARTRAG